MSRIVFKLIIKPLRDASSPVDGELHPGYVHFYSSEPNVLNG